MNCRRGSTCSPIRVVKIRSAARASWTVTLTPLLPHPPPLLVQLGPRGRPDRLPLALDTERWPPQPLQHRRRRLDLAVLHGSDQPLVDYTLALRTPIAELDEEEAVGLLVLIPFEFPVRTGEALAGGPQRLQHSLEEPRGLLAFLEAAAPHAPHLDQGLDHLRVSSPPLEHAPAAL